MSPWPPEGEPEGKGAKPVTLPRPGHADLAGRSSSATTTCATRSSGERAPDGRPRRRRRGREGAPRRDRDRRSRARPRDRWRRHGRGVEDATDAARATATRSAASSRSSRRRPPGLGSYAEKADRLDARLAAALMGIQAVKGVEIGDGFASHASRLGGTRRDRARQAPEDEPSRRDRGGVTNGSPVVVRAAMKPLPTLMRPRSVDLASGEPGEALVERSDVQAVEALAVVAEAAVAWELARAAREVRRRRARRLRRSARRVPRADRVAATRPRETPRARRLHGRRKVDARPCSPIGSAGRSSRSTPSSRSASARPSPRSSSRVGKPEFRALEEEALDVLARGPLGGRRARRWRPRLGTNA